MRASSCLPVYLLTVTLVGLIVLVASFMSFTSTSTEPHTKLMISVSMSPLSAPIYIAQEKGFFSAQGLDVQLVEVKGGHRALKTMLEGQTQLATSSDLPIMFNSFGDRQYAVVATFVQSERDLKVITHRDSGIVSISDIKGHRVGLIKGGSSQYFFDTLRLVHQIPREDVEVVYLAPEALPKALLEGLVDVIVPWEPHGFETNQLLGDNAQVLSLTDEVYRETFNLVADQRFIAAQPERLLRVLAALKDADDFIHNSSREAQQAIKQRLNVEQAFIDWCWSDFEFGLSLSQSLIHTLEAEARWAINNRLVDGVDIPNYLDYIAADSLKKIIPSAVTLVY